MTVYEGIQGWLSWQQCPPKRSLDGPPSGVGWDLGRATRRSQTVFPISRPSFVMCDGHDAHCGRFIPINNGKRKSVQHESAGSVPIRRPALRPLSQIFKRIVNLGKEFDTRLNISLSVPSLCSLHLPPCLWMETVRLTCWHRTAGRPSGGALLRTESSELCRSRCPRYGA